MGDLNAMQVFVPTAGSHRILMGNILLKNSFIPLVYSSSILVILYL